jgi:hypothetical protein
MRSERIGESAISTGVILPQSASRAGKLERLRAIIHVYEPQPGELAAALVRRALGNAGSSSASSS